MNTLELTGLTRIAHDHTMHRVAITKMGISCNQSCHGYKYTPFFALITSLTFALLSVVNNFAPQSAVSATSPSLSLSSKFQPTRVTSRHSTFAMRAPRILADIETPSRAAEHRLPAAS